MNCCVPTGVFADDGGAASGGELMEQPEPDSTTDSSGGVASASLEQHQPVRFKTPPRPTRVTVMPPTPPESGHGTPPQQVKHGSQC